MRHFPAIKLYFFLSFLALSLFTACGGGGSTSGTSSEVTQIDLSVSPTVLDSGQTAAVSATAKNAAGNQVTQATVAFSVDQGQNLISVSRGGAVCAGQWDSLTTPVVCTPATRSGTAHVIATAGSVKNQVAVVVLPPIDRLTVVPDDTLQPDSANLSCISQSSSTEKYTANTRTYTINASYKGNPVTLTDDMKDTLVTWSIDQAAIGTIAAQTTTDSATNTTTTDTRKGVVSAKAPGETQISATIGNHKSLPASFIVCPVKQITIAPNASATLPLSSSGTLTLTPTITDSRDNAVFLSTTDSSNNTTSLFSLAWNNSQTSPATVVAGTAGTATVTATASPGTSTIVASCTPPACNLGLGSVYSNPFVVPVSGTAPATTVYVGSAAQAADSTSTAPGKTLLPISTSGNAIGTAITLNDVPNSMMFSPNGLSLFIGSASGLITVSPGSTTTSINSAAPGRVLAVSPNNATVIVYKDSTSQLFVVTAATGAVQTVNMSGVTAAAFSVDSSKAYIVGTNNQTLSTPVGQLGVYAPSSSVVPEPILDAAGVNATSAASVTFLASGPFGYVGWNSTNGGGSAGLNVYASCNDMNTLLTSGTSNPPSRQVFSLTPVPDFLRALPDGFSLLTAAFPAAGTPQMNLLLSTTDEKGFVNPATGCAPAVSTTTKNTVTLSSSTGLVGKQFLVTSDGKNAFVLSNSGTLLGAKVDATAGTLTPVSIPLQSSVSGTPQAASVQQTTGGVTTSGGLLFFGGSDGQVHLIDLTATTPTDSPIVLTGAPAGFTPDFVAVQPK